MPKDQNSGASASHKCRSYSYKPYSNHGKGLAMIEKTSENSVGSKDWEDATCPICMDVPHNAVLLVCTSHEKGCRPFMCNSSYRHSNCLDQYRNAHVETHKTHGGRQLALESVSRDSLDLRSMTSPGTMNTEFVSDRQTLGRNFTVSDSNGAESPVGVQFFGRSSFLIDEDAGVETVTSQSSRRTSSLVKEDVKSLICPLCRGKVIGWLVVDAARKHLNHKARSCAQELCLFTGTYEELRVHARVEHPLARPTEIDPARQRDWRRLERQRDLGDVMSTIRSAMVNATVVGDYAIEDDFEDDNDDMDFPGDDGHWWPVFMLFQFFGPPSSLAGGGRFSPREQHHPRGHRSGNARPLLWEENLQHNGTNEANSSAESSATREQATGSSQWRQRRQHRAQGDMN